MIDNYYEVMKSNAIKLLKITKLNFYGKVRDWFKTINLALANWATLRTSKCHGG
jgi:hypothetical protein